MSTVGTTAAPMEATVVHTTALGRPVRKSAEKGMEKIRACYEQEKDVLEKEQNDGTDATYQQSDVDAENAEDNDEYGSQNDTDDETLPIQDVPVIPSNDVRKSYPTEDDG